MSAVEPLGSDARISSAPADELVHTGFSWETADAPLLHHGLNLADLSHVLTLADSELLMDGDTERLLTELLDWLEVPAAQFPYDPVHGDAYNSREHELKRRIGTTAGWLHTGRTRREAGRIAFRIGMRHRLLALHQAATTFCRELARAELRHADTIFADTTYLQPAQPSTFGHYLGSFAEEATRHLTRIQTSYAWTNRSPAGSGGVGGSPLVTDRTEMALTLGFDSPGAHTRDIMWSVDGLVDAAVTAAQTATTVDRLCEDLEIFASPAFGYVALDAALCRASVLIPQKRNPYATAVVRAKASVLIGRATGLMVAARTPSARTDNWIHGYRESADAVDDSRRLAELGARIVSTLQVDTSRLLQQATDNFTGATDLAEQILRNERLDYRTCYRIVGRAVADALADGRNRLDDADLDRAAIAILGTSLGQRLDVTAATDPAAIVATRTVLGGSAATAVREHARVVLAQCDEADRWRAVASERIQSAEADVIARARRRLGQ